MRGPKSARCPAITYGPQSDARLRADVAQGEAVPPLEWSRELGEVLGYALGEGYVRRSVTADALGIAADEADEELAAVLQDRIHQWFSVNESAKDTSSVCRNCDQRGSVQMAQQTKARAVFGLRPLPKALPRMCSSCC